MGWKEEFGSYFHFSKRDRLAILVMVVLILAVWAAPRFVGSNSSGNPVADTSWLAAARRLEAQSKTRTGNSGNNDREDFVMNRPDRPPPNKPVKPQPFLFDPNTVSESDWEKLGLRPRTITTIQNFRAKGGRFRQAEDLKKVYGLFPDEYERLAPFIRIEQDRKQEMKQEVQQDAKSHKPGIVQKLIVPVDINSADTAAFIALPGIGSKLASRIVLFREKLGGFYSVAQVGETFGLADSIFRKIKLYLKLETITIRRININTATTDEMKVHPYIRYQLAQTIVAYRNAHGKFESVDDVKKMMGITIENYNRLVPYLTVE